MTERRYPQLPSLRMQEGDWVELQFPEKPKHVLQTAKDGQSKFCPETIEVKASSNVDIGPGRYKWFMSEALFRGTQDDRGQCTLIKGVLYVVKRDGKGYHINDPLTEATRSSKPLPKTSVDMAAKNAMDADKWVDLLAADERFSKASLKFYDSLLEFAGSVESNMPAQVVLAWLLDWLVVESESHRISATEFNDALATGNLPKWAKTIPIMEAARCVNIDCEREIMSALKYATERHPGSPNAQAILAAFLVWLHRRYKRRVTHTNIVREAIEKLKDARMKLTELKRGTKK